jgi:hypothetical protein
LERTVHVDPQQFTAGTREHAPFVCTRGVRGGRRLRSEGERDCMVVEEIESCMMEKADETEVLLVKEVFGDVRGWQRSAEKNIFGVKKLFNFHLIIYIYMQFKK